MPCPKLARNSSNWWPREEISTDACGSSAASSRGEASVTVTRGSCDGICSRAAAGDNIGFIVEPQAAMLFQHAVGGLEVAAVADRFGQPPVLDLGDVDRRIPCREQRRGSDRAGDFIGQGVHVIAE